MQRKPKLKAEPKAQPIIPFPELVSRTGGWEIDVVPEEHVVGKACASRRMKHMVVPVEDTPRARSVRLHEMTHVKISPSCVSQEALRLASHDAILACEDMRVNAYLNIHMHDVWVGEMLVEAQVFPGDIDDMNNACVRGDLYAAAAILIARFRTGGFTKLNQCMYRILPEEDADTVMRVVYGANAIIHDDVLDFVTTVAAARLLDTLKPKKPEPGEGKGEYEELVDKGAEALEGGQDTEEILSEVRENIKDPEKLGKPKGPGAESFDGKVRWGKVRWEYPPLVRKAPIRKIGKSKRAYEEGCIPVNMHRLCSDGRVFSRKAKRFGGAVLIDQSGSMSLTPSQVESIVIAAPAVIVVGYCGSGSTGWMRVLAKNGKMVSPDDCYMMHGGNVIDYPALQWLAEQGEPRVWVSDAGVIGVSGSSRDQQRQCAAIVKANRIIRVEDADLAVEFLRKLR